jgi:hypothetical protein
LATTSSPTYCGRAREAGGALDAGELAVGPRRIQGELARLRIRIAPSDVDIHLLVARIANAERSHRGAKGLVQRTAVRVESGQGEP